MSWRRSTCRCCANDCELISVLSTCTLADDSTCGIFQGCGPVEITFGTPDSVAGRTEIVNHFLYPASGQNFRWPGGTSLSIFVRPRYIICNGTLFFFRHMQLEYGCPSDPENYTNTTINGRYTVINLPANCSGCVIKITADYFEADGDLHHHRIQLQLLA